MVLPSMAFRVSLAGLKVAPLPQAAHSLELLSADWPVKAIVAQAEQL